MSRRGSDGLGLALATGAAAIILLGGGIAAAAVSGGRKRGGPGPFSLNRWGDRDVEALARMIASENPKGSKTLHIEQIWTQIRSAQPGQSLFDLVTGKSGFGPQGGRRPVATAEEATDYGRQLAREVLEGRHESALAGARRFFEPAQQDLALAIANRARAKRGRGEKLTKQESRLLGYKRSAAQVREKWNSEGHRFIGTVDGVEFFS